MSDLFGRGRIEDFWGRADNKPRFEKTVFVFGRPIRLLANQPAPLEAGILAAASYSRDAAVPTAPFTIQFVVRPGPEAAPAPEHLVPHIQYTGSADWVHMQLGAWGGCFADLAAGKAWAVLDPGLAARPEVLSRGLMFTLYNNFFTRHGCAMLHATALLRGGRVLLLMAPHNSGKSTTALLLTLSGGFRMLTDSQVYVQHDERGFRLTGFPVGSARLRRDRLEAFPQLHDFLAEEEIRNETKFRVALRDFDPSLVCEEAVSPVEIDWCLLERTGLPETIVEPADESAVREAVLENSLHADSEAVWGENLRLIEAAMERSRFYHLKVGTEPEGILEKVRRL